MATNDHVSPSPPPPPPTSQSQSKRISPLEYRNTDLVSRLLAATPPYLYNMSMPNTYFFSEMLRSFVQAKAERSSNQLVGRRSRKRSWPQTSKLPAENGGNTGGSQTGLHQAKKLSIEDNPNLNSTALNTCFYDPTDPLKLLGHYPSSQTMTSTTQSLPTQSVLQTSQTPCQTPDNPSLILPPPPPIWYPPLQHPSHYNTPYGIDPLHFFIDLRVSGHIYDRKKAEKDELLPTLPTIGMNKTGVLKTSKHASAFSVPIKTANLNPINLSKIEDGKHEDGKHKPLKFDVKSLGLDGHNKTGINYVMNNIERVYKDLQEWTGEQHDYKIDRQEQHINDEELRDGQKKDLKDLIGLELAVDYMSHNNKLSFKHSEIEADRDGGGLVEVVDVQDDSDTNLDT